MKRILLTTAFALAIGATASAQAPAPPPAAPGGLPPGIPGLPPGPTFETVKVTENVYHFRYLGHRSMFIVTPEGVIVTDPIAFGRPEAARQYMAEIRKVTQAPIRYLVYSHSHYDHSGGGKVFKDAGAKVVAHRLARDRLSKVSSPEVVPVDEVVDDRRTLTLGGVRLDLIYLGRNHSDNMLLMLLPKEKIAFAVDWVAVGAAPAPPGFMGDTYPDEWVASLQALEKLDWDRMIPGHGPRLGTKDDVRRQIEYMTDAKAAAKALMDAGRCTPDGFGSAPVPAKYQGYAQPIAWSTALNRYCIYHYQGY